MHGQDYTITILVDKSPEEVFKAINDVRGWWDGEIDGDTDKVGAVFTYKYETFHDSKQKLVDNNHNIHRYWNCNYKFAQI